MTRYSGPGNIHSDLESARAIGLDACVAQGMMTMAYASELLTREIGPDWLERGDLSVKFIALVYDGDEVTVRAESDGEGWRVAAVNQHGREVMVGTARLRDA